MFPAWFHFLSIASLLVAFACALTIAADLTRHRQKMAVMNVVWPTTALFGSVFVLAGYFARGRASAVGGAMGDDPPGGFPGAVAVGALHCGAGCALGDLIGEWTLFAFPSIAAAFGWGAFFADKMFATWILDFILAFGFGVFFQYFAIAPMRGLSPGAGLLAAVKADSLSLISWQVGMYGLMALAQLLVLPSAFGARADADTPEFWFVMQLAMLAGFATAFPVNWALIRAGVKERM